MLAPDGVFVIVLFCQGTQGRITPAPPGHVFLGRGSQGSRPELMTGTPPEPSCSLRSPLKLSYHKTVLPREFGLRLMKLHSDFVRILEERGLSGSFFYSSEFTGPDHAP